MELINTHEAMKKVKSTIYYIVYEKVAHSNQNLKTFSMFAMSSVIFSSFVKAVLLRKQKKLFSRNTKVYKKRLLNQKAPSATAHG